MDKRLRLTSEQEYAIARFEKAFKDLKATGVILVQKVGEVYAMNGEHVDECIFIEDVEEHEFYDEDFEHTVVEFDELPHLDFTVDFLGGCLDDSFGVVFKGQEG